MTYSHGQERLAAWTWIALMAIVGAIGVRYTIGAVRDIFRLGLSTGTASTFLLVTGVALLGLSNATATLLFTLSPSRFERSPRWFLLALGLGMVMIILGTVGSLG